MSALSRAPQPAAPREIAVFDAAVPDRETLIAGLRPGVEAVRLSGGGDGLAEIATRLADGDELAALHVVSHGAAGRIVLGDSVISAASLRDHARSLEAIAARLAPSATVQLYACCAGSGPGGRELMARLAEMTGAAVRASATPTGSAELGGDWDLAVVHGTASAADAFTETGAYGHVLMTIGFSGLDGTPSFTEDSGSPATLDADVTVSDPEFDAKNAGSGDYAGGQLAIARNGGANAVDVLDFDTAGASFSVNGTDLEDGSNNVFASFGLSGGTLTVDFTSAETPATTALVIDVLQRITYTNASDTPAASVDLDWTISDDAANTDTGTTTVSIAAANDAPTLGTNTGVTLDEAATTAIATGELQATDPEEGPSALTYTLNTAPSNATLFIDANGNGALDGGEGLAGGDTFTQAEIDNGKLLYAHDGSETVADSFDVTVDDGAGGSTAQTTVNLTVNAVNDAPTLSTNTGVTLDEGATKNIASTTLAATDAEGDAPLTYTLDTAPSNATLFVDANGNGTLDGGEALSGGGSFTQAEIDNGKLFVVHDGSETTSDSFAVTVGDGSDTSGSQTVSLTVNAVNDAPTAADDSASAQAGQAQTIGVLGNDGDPEGDSLTVAGIASAPSNGTASVNPDSTVTYTANGGFEGTDSFTYTLDDGNGGTDTGTVTVTVGPDVNDAPTAVNDSFTVTEDGSATFDVLANDSDADGDTLTVTLRNTPANGDASVNGDGTIAYTPDADFAGSDSFTYTVADGNGATATGDISVTVTAVNDDPTAEPDSFTVPGGQASTLAVLANDSDVDGDALTVTLNNTPANATASVDGNGAVTFTPDEGFFGETSFKYTVTDAKGSTATATATVTVSGSAGLPDARDDSFSLDEDSKATLDVLANDQGAAKADVTLTSSPANATAKVNDDGSIAFTPDTDFFGETSFAYTLTNDAGGTDTATIEITVNSVNDAPEAKDDSFEVQDGIATAIDVLANDTDADGDDLRITFNDTPADGTARVDDQGRLLIQPDAGFSGENTITYTVGDGNGGSATATATVTVVDSGPDLQLLDLSLTEQASAMYVGYFGRAPDPNGLEFWEDQLTNATAPIADDGLGQSPAAALDNVAEALRLDDEAQDLFPFLAPDVDPAGIGQGQVADFVNSVFRNLFNRDAAGTAGDPTTGLGFWVGEIQDRLDQGINIGDIIVDITSGAQNADANTVANKIRVADAYGNALDQDDFDRPGARAILDDIDAGSQGVQDALEQIDSLAQALTGEVDLFGV